MQTARNLGLRRFLTIVVTLRESWNWMLALTAVRSLIAPPHSSPLGLVLATLARFVGDRSGARFADPRSMQLDVVGLCGERLSFHHKVGDKLELRDHWLCQNEGIKIGLAHAAVDLIQAFCQRQPGLCNHISHCCFHWADG
jgi:hypothetical protein